MTLSSILTLKLTLILNPIQLFYVFLRAPSRDLQSSQDAYRQGNDAGTTEPKKRFSL